jgi:hypothetical protein
MARMANNNTRKYTNITDQASTMIGK